MARLWIAIFVVAAAAFDLVREYAGNTFTDAWTYYDFWDNLTSGDVQYLSREDAISSALVSTNAQQNTVIRVDNSTNVPFNYKRNSIRITSNDTYDFGTLWVIDVVHLPYGCSVWPSIWTRADTWPVGGEIDIIEGINLQQTNQIALHTPAGCMHATEDVTQSGASGTLNCSIPAGCTVLQPGRTSFGALFAQSGGGVWATQYDVAGIFIWFWNRGNVPPSATSRDSIDISTWGAPVASFPTWQGCNTAESFGLQRLVIDITLCGVWAGVPSIYNATCAGTGPTGKCYNDNVIGPGSPKYDDAYFEISHIRAYTTAAPSPTSPSEAQSPPPTTTGAQSPPQSGAADAMNVPFFALLLVGVGTGAAPFMI